MYLDNDKIGGLLVYPLVVSWGSCRVWGLRNGVSKCQNTNEVNSRKLGHSAKGVQRKKRRRERTKKDSKQGSKLSYNIL